LIDFEETFDFARATTVRNSEFSQGVRPGAGVSGVSD
jgi:hypothetical protein